MENFKTCVLLNSRGYGSIIYGSPKGGGEGVMVSYFSNILNPSFSMYPVINIIFNKAGLLLVNQSQKFQNIPLHQLIKRSSFQST